MIWKLALPAVLIIIGLSFIFKDTFDKKVSEEIKKLNEKKNTNNEYCATFSGQTANFDGEKFNGANLTAVFGGVDEKKKNKIENDEAHTIYINATCIFGGAEVK